MKWGGKEERGEQENQWEDEKMDERKIRKWRIKGEKILETEILCDYTVTTVAFIESDWCTPGDSGHWV